MKTINSLISVIVMIVMLASPQMNVSAADVLTWENRQDMPTERYSMGAAVSGGKIYAIGGDNYSCTPLTTVEEYDPDANTWSTRASMPTGRWSLGAAAGPDGKIYAIGGAGGNCGADILGTVEMYDPVTDTWESRTSMPTPRMELRVAAAANGKIYAMGGKDNSNWFATVEEYDPATDTWAAKNNMPWANKLFAITAASDGKIYVLGGDANPQALLVYDPATDSWESRASMPTPRYNLAMSQASNGRIYAVGGDWGGVTNLVESYNPEFNSWSDETWISTPRSGHSVVTAGNAVFVLGGWGGSGPISSVEAGTITSLPPLLYAKQDGLTSGSCGSWDTACDLQYALTSAVSGQEIWAAAGVYKPTSDPADRTATFQIKNGVGLYGGFDGTETTRDERNWETNKTVLSGDIDNNDVNNDGNFVAESTADIQGENIYHVVTGSGTNNTAILDGFIITAGQATSDSFFYAGGGMYNDGGNPTLENITFAANIARTSGGGIYNEDCSNPVLKNVTFSSNKAVNYPYLQSQGGGMYTDSYCHPILSNVVFYNNSADQGGGMYNRNNHPTLTNVVFHKNSAREGGGIYNDVQGSPTLTNVTFFANTASYGGGIFNYDYSSVTLINSILWGDIAQEPWSEIYSVNASITITYSNVQGGWPSTGNIDADPLFVEPASGDLHLQAGSPAIDSGTNEGCPSTDLDGITRPQDGNYDGTFTCDMGAYEVVGAPPTPPANDNFVDATIIDTLPISLVVDNIFATREAGEPEYCDYSPKTVWYSFTPSADMSVYADMVGSSFGDTAFKVYQANGLGIGDLSFMKCASNGDTAIFSVQAGMTYYIQAGSINSFGGELHLNLKEVIPPANDNFSSATSVTSLPFSDAVDTTFATTEESENQYCYYSPRTVWYKFTAAADSEIKVSTEGSSFSDITLTAYQDTGSGLGGLQHLGCTSYVDSFAFAVQAGTTYYIQAGSISSSGDMHINVQEVPPPPNDDFANTTPISSPLPFDETIDVSGASAEDGEPAPSCGAYGGPYKSVWYAYTPDENGTISASIPSSFYIPILAVYTGSDLTNLNELGCQVYTGSTITLSVNKGTTYYFQISKYTSTGLDGPVQFLLEEKHPPANDNFVNATIAAPLPFSNTVDISDATTEPNEPQYCNYSPKTVWYSFTTDTSMLVQVDMSGSSFWDTTFTVYQAYGPSITDLGYVQCASFGDSARFTAQAGMTYYIQAGSIYGSGGSLQLNLQEIQRPINDDFANAISIEALPYSNTQDTSSATSSPDDPTTCTNNGSVWYRFTATSDSLIDADTFGSNYDTVLSVYTGEQGSLVQVTEGCNDDYNGLQSHVAFPATPGTTYYFLIGRCCGSGGSGGGYLQFNVKEIARPANDDFAKAKDIAVDALPFNDSVDIGNATIEPGEPQGCYYSPKTVWYSFTPTENMLVQVDMFGSTFWDTVLNIYEATGPSMSDLTFLKCANFGETAKFTAQAGVTYYLQAGSYYGSSGILQLNLQELPRPVNDDFVNAALIPGPLPFDGTVNTQNATREGNEPRSACSYSSDPGTVWYAYTPTTSGSVSASIPRSSYMPVVVAVYTGNSLSSLTEAGCMTTYGGDRLTFRANTNTTYYLQLSNYHTWEQGEINLYLETAPLPVAVFDYAPFDPSTFDTIHFSDISYDPGYVNFESFTWDFGDGTISTEENPDHKYAKDGDYTVQHSVITFDGRTASTSQVVHVKTRDVAIAKLSAPQSASPGQTRTITVSVSSKAYPETVQIDLYRSTVGGFELIDTLTQTVPAYNANRTVAYNFSYTFTSSDASIGKVTFYAVATIVGGRDIYPADNEAYSLPTKVNKRR